MDHLTRLLLEAQAGRRDALERFVAATQQDVMAVCRYLGDPDTADDLAQETYRRALASLHRFRADGPAKHWLLTIARRTCVDSTRKRQRRRRLARRLDAERNEASDPSVSSLELDDLLFALDPDRRAAFVLTQINGLRYHEAAHLLDVPIGTVRSRVARARAELADAVRRAEDVGRDAGRDGGPDSPRARDRLGPAHGPTLGSGPGDDRRGREPEPLRRRPAR